MIDDEPHVEPPLETRRCAVCGEPRQPGEAWYCAKHRQHEGDRAGGGHHLIEVLLLGFVLLAAMLAVLLVFA